MKILFGIPVRIHREIAEAEVMAFKKLGVRVETSFYGNSNNVKGIIQRFILILKNAINLKKKLERQKSDIVYLNSAFDSKTLIRDSISIFIIRLFNKRVKIVLKTHGTIKSVVYSKSMLEKYVFNNTDLLLVLSKEEQNNFHKVFKEKNKVQITANPIDFVDFKTDPSFKHKLKITEETIVLLFSGRFLEQKGILDLIQACKIVNEKSICFKLICLGNGPLFDLSKQLADELHLKNKIEFLGHIAEEKTQYYYANCDVTILPSYREGFPMAIFQSVAAGKPVITTRINACADYFKEYENCLWVETKNPSDLAEKIITLAKNNELRDTMGMNNLKLAQRFTSFNIVGNLNKEFKNF